MTRNERPTFQSVKAASCVRAGLVDCLTTEVSQEVGIDLVGDSGGGIRLVAIDRTVLTREDRFAARSDVVASPVKAFGDTILTQE